MVPPEEIVNSSNTPIDSLIAIDESVGGEVGSTVENELEKVLLWSYAELGSEQMVKAKEEFYWKMGKVFPDDDFFANRMSYFIDHFIFERPVESHKELGGSTPYEVYTQNNDVALHPYLHSLFVVVKKTKSKLQLKSLITSEKIQITARPQERLDGIQKKDILQCFVYQMNQQFFMSKGVIFHPYRSYKIIRKKLKKVISSENFQASKLLHSLARKQLRHCRHIHVDPRKFYQDDQI
ncbi:MAG: hypothetical protein HRU19_07935 [Pseudobacteriovorax sp.]|nr:hypothetical protein [Pseudobacteriovorax sp.]